MARSARTEIPRTARPQGDRDEAGYKLKGKRGPEETWWQPWASSLQNSQKEMSVVQVTQPMAFHCGGLAK